MSNVLVKMKVSIAGEDFSYYPGQEINIDSDLAEKWVSVGHAEYANPPSEKVNVKRKRSSKATEGSDE